MPDFSFLPATFAWASAVRARVVIVAVWVAACGLPLNLIADADLASQDMAIRQAVEVVADSVVQIRTIGGLEQVSRRLIAPGPTTGLIISQDGFILSSAFGFVQEPTTILVTLPNGQQAPANLVATDHSRKIVLLKVAGARDLPAVPLTAATELDVGAWAIAVGRTFQLERPNVSLGIISARDRMFGRALQTDAAISAANYGGPLIDIWGRVLGLIVPMAPHHTSELAGSEWYDSGIGFAVELAPLAERIDRMKEGEDQYAGVLGVGLPKGNPYQSAAEIVTVRPQSAADRAGLRPRDTIVELNGEPVKTITDARFSLGPRYAGDKLKVAILRDDQRIEKHVTLTGPLGAFRHAFLGILPMRKRTAENADPKSGIDVRMVYPDSPAEQAGLRAGDRLLTLNGEKVPDIDGAINLMNGLNIGDVAKVVYDRDGDQQEATVTTSGLPDQILSQLPAAYHPDRNDGEEDADVVTGKVDINLPEYPNTCEIYVPQSLARRVPAGILFVLANSGDDEEENSLMEPWINLCELHDLIFVLPSVPQQKPWNRSDLSYLRRVLGHILDTYRIDQRRVVVHGEGGAGGMAYLLGISGQRVVRGISVVNAAPPRLVAIPDASPAIRMAVFSAHQRDQPVDGRSRSGLRKIIAGGYPVTIAAIAQEQGLDAAGSRATPPLDRRVGQVLMPRRGCRYDRYILFVRSRPAGNSSASCPPDVTSLRPARTSH